MDDYKLTSTLRIDNTSWVLGVIDDNIKLPKWNPSLSIPTNPFESLPIEVSNTHLSPYLNDYARMTNKEIYNWCRISRLDVSDNVMTNLHTIFEWLYQQNYLTEEQKIICKSTELWDEEYWSQNLLDQRWSLTDDILQHKLSDELESHALFNNARLEDIDTFEFRWWYLSIVYKLANFDIILNLPVVDSNSNIIVYNSSKILSLDRDAVEVMVDNRLIIKDKDGKSIKLYLEDKNIIPQLSLLYNTSNFFQILCQQPDNLEYYIVEAKNPVIRQQLDILPAPIQLSSIYSSDPGWEQLEYYHMNILAYKFIQSVQLPKISIENVDKIIDVFPTIKDNDLFAWLNIYIIYNNRWDLELNLAKLMKMPQYFVAPWNSNNRKLYFGTYWQRSEINDDFVARRYKSIGML